MNRQGDTSQANTMDYEKLCSDKTFDRPEMFRMMDPQKFTRDYYNQSGLSEVLLFKCPPSKLGMNMVDGSFGVDEIVQAVGGDRIVTAFDVHTQEKAELTLNEFVHKYKNPDGKRILNIVALDFSSTKLADMVTAPALLKQIDWSSAFPDYAKFRSVHFDAKSGGFKEYKTFPSIVTGGLISPGGAFTDFHVDLGGSTNYIHILKGRKIFFMIPPTAENLVKYEKLTDRDLDFFGYHVDKCVRIELQAGDSLIMPSGWIHAVWTPEDSIAFGGSILHTRAISMQLNIQNIEERTKLDDAFRFPYLDHIILHHISSIVQKCTNRVYIRPQSRNKRAEGEYVGKLFFWEKHHHRLLKESAYNDEGLCKEPLMWEETNEYYSCNALISTWEKSTKKPKEETDSVRDEKVITTRSSAKLKPKTSEEAMENAYFDGGSSDEENADPLAVYNDDLFINHAVFFHPNAPVSFSGLSAIHRLPLSADEPAMNIDQDKLRECIHPMEISELEKLTCELLKKAIVDLPSGLSRPNSLLAAFMILLRERRKMVEVESPSLILPRSILPDEKLMHTKEVRKRRNKKKGSDEDSDYEEETRKGRRKKFVSGGGTTSRRFK